MLINPHPFKKPYLITRSLDPENQETPIEFITTNKVPNRLFYRRNHFSYPKLTFSNYWLPISGHVQKPTLFSLQQLMSYPSKTLDIVLECAGNKRHFFQDKVYGEQWEKGALSQGKWKGVPLKSLLDIVGIKDGVKEVVFEGYDHGYRPDLDNVYPYARSLPLDKALHADTLIAYEYNDKPISFKHGFPLRLIVPQWYGMAAVKWLKQIRVIDTTFSGPFQSIDYVYYPNKNNDEHAVPVTTQKVNSTIQKPLNLETLSTGTYIIKGIAWTGQGKITSVEVSTNNGKQWSEAKLDTDNGNYGWVRWSFEWHTAEKGEYTILSRATDSHQRIQPATAFWNRKGYGYNAIDEVKVKVE